MKAVGTGRRDAGKLTEAKMSGGYLAGTGGRERVLLSKV